jgi:hypothetical protein
LQPNVEINAALLLDAVGLPREAFMRWRAPPGGWRMRWSSGTPGG